MKKLGTIQLMTILLGASLLAACAPLAPLANPNPTVPAVSTVVTATTVSAPVITTTVAPLTPLATSTPKSSSTSSTSPATGNCTLLTKDDVSKVLAQAVEEVKDAVHNGSICEYQTKNLILVLAVANVPGVPGVQTMQRVLASLGGGVDVPGLGDEAFYSLLNSHAILSVRKGDSVYSFTLKGVSPADTLSLEDAQAKEKALAELLLSHLP